MSKASEWAKEGRELSAELLDEHRRKLARARRWQGLSILLGLFLLAFGGVSVLAGLHGDVLAWFAAVAHVAMAVSVVIGARASVVGARYEMRSTDAFIQENLAAIARSERLLEKREREGEEWKEPRLPWEEN